jgi:hypothetical protein
MEKMDNVKSVSGKLEETDEKITEYSASKDGVTRSIRVREVENGFIVEVTEESHKEEQWYYAKQTFISEENPLEDEDKEEESTEKDNKSNGPVLAKKIKTILEGIKL